MSWTQKQLDEFFRKLNQRASTDPEFRKKFSENSKAAMEEVAGRELPDEFSLKLIEHNGNYSVAFVAPDFPQGEVELRELTENEQDQVNAGGRSYRVSPIAGCDHSVTVAFQIKLQQVEDVLLVVDAENSL